MRIPRSITTAAALVLALATAGWTAFHIELSSSHPQAEQTLEEAPTEVWLRFSVQPDTARSSFSIRGPEGRVELGEIVVGDEPEVLRADVVGALPAGDYTVSWVAAPMDDHAVRGRFGFTVAAAR